MQQAQGDLAASLTSYQASLAIRERPAKADPGNAGWQRDLSVSQENIGEVQQAQGDLAAALTSYRASLTISERLAKADPGNAGWRRDLSVSHDRIGDVQQAARRLFRRQHCHLQHSPAIVLDGEPGAEDQGIAPRSCPQGAGLLSTPRGGQSRKTRCDCHHGTRSQGEEICGGSESISSVSMSSAAPQAVSAARASAGPRRPGGRAALTDAALRPSFTFGSGTVIRRQPPDHSTPDNLAVHDNQPASVPEVHRVRRSPSRGKMSLRLPLVDHLHGVDAHAGEQNRTKAG